MASIGSDPGGLRRILFVAPDGKRKTIRLGKCSQRNAEAFKLRVEQLLEALHLGKPLSGELAQWVAGLPDAMAERLAKAGLIEPRTKRQAAALGPMLDAYVSRRTDAKPATAINWGHTRRCLVQFFGADREAGTITPAEAGDWVRWLRTGEAREHRYADAEKSEGLAANTVRKRTSNAKQFFADAVERGLIERNPFAKLKGAVGANRSRDFFVTRDMAAAVLDACPDNEWRLLFALSRFAGLRCPSEHLALTWADIDWERGRMTVRSPKTEHHEGKGSRVVPIFPELRPFLDAAWDAAAEGQTHVIARYRDAKQNLRTQLGKIIQRAGLTPWPKLWQNLRASMATELAAGNPAHVCSAWLGHSRQVAERHYLQVVDADFERVAQNPAHQALKSDDKPLQAEKRESQELASLSRLTTHCNSIANAIVGGTGCELPLENTGNRRFSRLGGTESGTLGTDSDAAGTLRTPGDDLPHGTECLGERSAKSAKSPTRDPRLAALVDVWPSLSEAARLAVLQAAGIDAATPDKARGESSQKCQRSQTTGKRGKSGASADALRQAAPILAPEHGDQAR